jgi:hypothetical protein
VADLARDAAKIDPVETILRWGQRRPPTEVGQPVSVVDPGSDASALATARRAAGPIARSQADHRQAREMAITERLERKLANGA